MKVMMHHVEHCIQLAGKFSKELLPLSSTKQYTKLHTDHESHTQRNFATFVHEGE
jgi:hypothetical protein